MRRLNRLLLAVLALAHPTCNQAIMTAPSGSTIFMQANPEFIPANGGVAVISALVIEPAGTVVVDGTVIQFFTNLGTIDEQGKTNDGVARVNLRANGRSGVASVIAFSGGEAVPAPSPSASAGGGVSIAATDGVEVTIGNVGAASVLVTADPSRITVSRSTQIRATVFDNAGNHLPGVPVYFDVTSAVAEDPVDGANSNFMDSGGRPQFTDSSGQAFDVMRTRNAGNGTATVRARVPTSEGVFKEGFVVVQIQIE